MENLHPIESCWVNYGPAESTSQIREQIDKQFHDITEWLLFGTIDFDFISEALLPSQYKNTSESFTVGEMQYDAVIVPELTTIRSTTLKALQEFRNAGGKVIFAGQCPAYVDAVISKEAKNLCEHSIKIPYNKVSILNALKDLRLVEIKKSNGENTDNLIYNMREDNDCKWLFIAHAKKNLKLLMPKEDTTPQKIKIYIAGCYKPEFYKTINGEIYDIPYAHKKGKTVIEYEMHQNDSILLNLKESTEQPVINSEKQEILPTNTFRITGKVDYTRSEPNVLLLDRAEYSLDGEPFNPEEEILILDNECRVRMGWPLRADQNTQPWVVPDEPIKNNITLKFKIYSEIDYSGANLAIEDAKTVDINFNGVKVSNEPNGWFTDKTIDTVALPEIKKGINELIVKVPFGKRTNTEWCYILGEFGVKVEGTISTLISQNDKIGFSTITNQGMPFYGGNLIYRAEINTPNCDAVIRATFYRGALIKVFVDGKEQGIIAYSPYKLKLNNLTKGKHTVELLLYGTRINTLGGMHNIPQPTWVGPDYWRTTGDKWCYEYLLRDVGILASPIIDIYEK